MSQAKIIIRAQDKTKDGINSAKKNLKGLNDVASSLGINLGKLSATTAIVAGLTALAKGAKECTEAFLKTENTYLTLKSTLSDTQSYNKAISSIDKLSKYTLSTKEDVTKLYTELAQLGKSDTEINKIITASISLSNVTGKSLTESFNVMLDSLDGSTGTLQKYLPEVKNLTKEELALGEAIDIVNEAFSDTAKSISTQSYSQQIKNIKDDIQTIAEDIGSILMNSLSPVFSWLEEKIGEIANSIAEEASKVETKATLSSVKSEYESNSTQSKIITGYQNAITASSYSEESTSYKYAMQGVTTLINSAITTAESAFDAYEVLMRLVDEGLLSADSSFFETVKKKIVSIDANTISTYNELKKKGQDGTGNGSSSGSNGLLWSSDTERNTAQTVFDSIWSNYKNILNIKKGGDGGYQPYEDGDSDRTKTLIDCINRLSTDASDFTFIVSNFSEKMKSEFREAGSYSTSQWEDIFDTFKDDFNAENEKILSKYTELCNDVISDIDKSLSSNASNYLSKESYEGYTEYIQLQLLKEVQELAREAELVGGSGDPRVAYLKEIATNIENKIVPNLKDNVNSYISANSSVLSAELQKFFERQTYTDTIATFEEMLVNMQTNENAGYESYSDEVWKAVKELKAYSEKALSDYDKGISEIASYITSNSSYLTDKTLQQQQIKTAEENLAKTDEMIDALYRSGDFNEEELQKLHEIRNGQIDELKELKKSNSSSGLSWNNVGDSFDSFLDKFSSESIDSSLLGSLSGALSDLFDAIEPLISVILSSNPIIAFLIQIVKEMAEILSPFLSDTIKPFTDLIHNLAESLSGWVIPILNVIKGVLSGVCDILEMVFIPILEMITPLIEGICGILQILKPVMEWLKNCFIDISTVFTFVADAIKYAIWSFLNWLDSINIWGWTPFAGAGGYDVSTLDSYDRTTGGLNIANTKKALQEKYTYDVTDWTATNGNDTSTSTSVSTASYTGSNNYYFNIYQQAPVVGDGGMQEFAMMIKKEFAELAYMSA